MSNPSIAQTFKAGDKLAGCYTLKEMLPQQGLCVVWLAQDEELNKDIALHFVPDSVAADSRAMTELKQEAKRNRQLIHPRIVRVHDLVEDEKWAAISMDNVQGESLAALQKKHDKNALNPSEIAAGIPELCQTLEDAHRIDLFHRDLTPENLISTANGLMVQKFGISRVILDSLARGGQQVEAQRDIAYISPQQLDSERASRADDIYSLGASLYDVLTGAPPFTEGELIPQIRKTVPPLVSERRAAKGITGEPTPKAWDDTIAACLAKTPDERPKSAAEAGTRFASGKVSGATVSPIAAAEAATAAAAVTAAAVAETAKAAEPSKPAEPAQETRQQKRPWGPGPAKAPVIAEATVLSKTAVPKGETKSEAAPESKPEVKPEPAKEKSGEPAATGGAGGGAKKGGPTTPTGFPLRAFVEVEGDAKPQKKKSAAGLIIAGVVVAVVVVGYLVASNKGDSGNSTPENAVASSSPAGAEATPSPEEAASPSPAEASSPVPTPVNVAMAATPTPAPEAEATPSPAAVAESPTPAPAIAPPSAATIASLATLSDEQAQEMVAEKAKAVDQAKAALADAEKAAADKVAAQTQAAASIQQIQASIKARGDAAAAAKKAADDAAASLKQQQDALQKAEADAADAQKVAAAKAQAVDQQRKALQDAEAAAEHQQTAQQQAEAEAADMTKAIAAQQKAADDAAKAAAAAQQARQQQTQALAQAQADLSQLQAGLQQAQQARTAEKARKAAEEALRIQKERAAQTARLAQQAAAAAKAAADAQKALEAAQKAVADAEAAQKAAEQQAEAARNGALPMPTAAPETNTPAGTPTPAPTAAPTATPPATAANTPTLSVHAQNPHLKVDQALANSLGMRFAPVGNVFFSIWLTRVQDFDAFARATGYKASAWRNPGFKQAPDHPVVFVSWNDANQFCLWLTEKEHREGILSANETYRLPTDLEWSNAVGLPAESGRSPADRDMDVPDVYPWGTQWPPPSGAGNYTGEETDSDVAIKGYNDGFAWTSPVGSFTANKFGLYDMGGNVWEWCLDWWNSEQKARVLRGASWDNGALKLSLLSSCRIHAKPDEGNDDYGFRVVLAQEMSKPGKHHGQTETH